MEKQLGFIIINDNIRCKALQNLHDNLLMRLETSMLNYNLTVNDVNYVQLLFF